MAKKTLLTEGEFKKFMKLARLEPIAAEKLAEMYAPGKADDDEEDVTEEGRKTKKPKKVMREEELELDEDLAALFEEDDEMRGGEEETAMEPVGEPMDEPMDDEMDMPDVEMTDDDMGGDEASELKAGIESSLEDLLGKLDQLMDMAGAGDMMDVETDEEGDEGIEGDEGGDTKMGAALPHQKTIWLPLKRLFFVELHAVFRESQRLTPSQTLLPSVS